MSVPADPAELDALEPIVRSRAVAAPGAGAIFRLTAVEAQELFPALIVAGSSVRGIRTQSE